MANRARSNKVRVGSSPEPNASGLRNPQCAAGDKKNNLCGRFKGKGLLKSLMAEKKRESRS